MLERGLSRFTSTDGGLTASLATESAVLRGAGPSNGTGAAARPRQRRLPVHVARRRRYASQCAESLQQHQRQIPADRCRWRLATAIPADNPFAAAAGATGVFMPGACAIPGAGASMLDGDIWEGDVAQPDARGSEPHCPRRELRLEPVPGHAVPFLDDLQLRGPAGTGAGIHAHFVAGHRRQRRHRRLCLPWLQHAGLLRAVPVRRHEREIVWLRSASNGPTELLANSGYTILWFRRARSTTSSMR